MIFCLFLCYKLRKKRRHIYRSTRVCRKTKQAFDLLKEKAFQKYRKWQDMLLEGRDCKKRKNKNKQKKPLISLCFCAEETTGFCIRAFYFFPPPRECSVDHRKWKKKKKRNLLSCFQQQLDDSEEDKNPHIHWGRGREVILIYLRAKCKNNEGKVPLKLFLMQWSDAVLQKAELGKLSHQRCQ